MKYLKLLLIPILGFMFMVPAKADATELPDHDGFKSNGYIIFRFDNGDEPEYILHFSEPGYNFIYTTGNRLRVFSGSEAFNFRYREGSIYLGDWTGFKIFSDSYDYSNKLNARIIYSSEDVYDQNGNLVFQKTPVNPDLATATRVALENLGMEVQGASGKISLIGGMILGLLLVPVLVTRLRLWVRV